MRVLEPRHVESVIAMILEIDEALISSDLPIAMQSPDFTWIDFVNLTGTLNRFFDVRISDDLGPDLGSETIEDLFQKVTPSYLAVRVSDAFNNNFTGTPDDFIVWLRNRFDTLDPHAKWK
jgi:hypothetical protein